MRSFRYVVSLLLVVGGFVVPCCHSWSIMGLDPVPSKTSATTTTTTTTRRRWIRQILYVGVATSAASSTTTLIANAACLPGDLSKDCIGVYKVPIDDSVLPYVSTPEALSKFAPDLKYVPPVSIPKAPKEAWEVIQAQRLAADDIQTVVMSGRLEEAGIKVLNLVPKITTSGRVIVRSMGDDLPPSIVNDLRMERLKDQFDLALGLWGECDVMIGQGLRGEMGVSAAAQLQILNNLKEATAALDDFLASAVSAEKQVNKNKSSGS
jgi:hypothetical protein